MSFFWNRELNFIIGFIFLAVSAFDSINFLDSIRTIEICLKSIWIDIVTAVSKRDVTFYSLFQTIVDSVAYASGYIQYSEPLVIKCKFITYMFGCVF